MAGKPGGHWYNNGQIERKFYSDQPIPENFIKGRLSFSDKTKQKMSEAQKQVQARPEIKLNNQIKHKALWQDPEYREKVCAAQKQGWTEEARKRLSEKNKGKTLSSETKEKIKQSIHKTYEDPDLHKKISEKVKLAQTEEYWEKRHNTLIKNKSFNSSKPEEEAYDILCQKYGKENIIRQYKEDRYPFYCDFYIISQDKFIELNLHWTHGGFPWDKNNPICKQQLQKWEEKAKNSQFYKNAIEIWTVRDVEKFLYAKENNLNYITIYSKEEMANL